VTRLYANFASEGAKLLFYNANGGKVAGSNNETICTEEVMDFYLCPNTLPDKGYFESVLKSDNGEIDGKWLPQPFLFEEDGGHGMIFRDFGGGLKFSLHTPNHPNGAERVVIFDIEDKNGIIKVK